MPVFYPGVVLARWTETWQQNEGGCRMGRKKKFINRTHYPDWVIERFTRCIFDDVLAFFATEEGQQEYAQWEAQQEALKKKAPPKQVEEVNILSRSHHQT